MIVGLCRAEIYFPDSHSLKDKRHVLHSIKDRLKKLNVSVAEVGELDLWQRTTLAVACVANEGGHVEQVLTQALNLIQAVPTIEVLDSRIELL
ncbi:MAG: DUF503 domain-containing protein [Nitrospiraceae bacterium]